MRSLEDIEKASAAARKRYRLTLYFSICVIGILISAFSNPEAAVIYDLTDPIRYIGEISFGLLGLGIIHLAIFDRSFLSVVHHKLARKFLRMIFSLWSIVSLYGAVVVLIEVISLHVALTGGYSVQQGAPLGYANKNRTISFSLDGLDYRIKCSYGCNYPVSREEPQLIKVYSVIGSDKVFKIDKVR